MLEAGDPIYRPRHPERTAIYRVLFHNFDRFLSEYERRFEKKVRLCSTHGHECRRMRVVAFLTEYGVVDRIIRHLALTFVAKKPPPAYAFEQVALVAAEESGEHE